MSRRKHKIERHLINLPLVVSTLRGKVLDGKAIIRDLTPAGFGFETSHAFHQGQSLVFETDLGASERVRGLAEVRWVRSGDWGVWVGAQITSISWSDARKIKRAIRAHVYDWEGFWDRALIAAFLICLAWLAQELLR